MEEELKFIYNKEYWYVSAFINTKHFKFDEQKKEIEQKLKEKLRNLKPTDMPGGLKDYGKEKSEQISDKVIELGSNISLKCKWIVHIPNLDYCHENIESKFDELGSFRFEIEYYKSELDKKESVEPLHLQQIAIIALDELKNYNYREFNFPNIKSPIYIDGKSPIFICVISNEIKPKRYTIKWNEKNIQKYRRIIGKWTEIYSGSWDDYSEELFESRVESNLSNRESELHYLRGNSGFIYITKKSFDNCEDYVMNKILNLTAKVRAILFALFCINESLDVVSNIQRAESAKKKEKRLKAKIKKLDDIRRLRQDIQERMMSFLNELVYGQRYHYKSVIRYLMKQFQIEKTYERISKKFDVIYDSIENESLKHQLKQEKNLQYLNILIIAGVIAQMLQFYIYATTSTDAIIIFMYAFGIILLLGFLMLVIFLYLMTKEKSEEPRKLKTVDAVIIDKNTEKIILIKRNNIPYRDYYALPGCFIENKKGSEEDIKERVKSETGLSIKNLVEIEGPFKWDKTSKIESFVYECVLDGVFLPLCGKNVSEVECFSREELKDVKLAFNHKKMIKKARIFGEFKS